jgi:hypothetical protein
MTHYEVAAVSAALCLACSAEAYAEDEPEPTSEPPNWSLGAGIDFSGPQLGGQGVGGLASATTDPRMSVMLERRVAEPLWLLMKLSGSYARHRELSTTSGQPASRTYAGAGALGVRVVFTPDEPFQVSMFSTLGLSLGRSTLDQSKARSWAAAMQLGLALDRELIENLGVRLATVLATASYARSDYEQLQGGVLTNTSSDGWGAAVTLSPSIELRFSF